VGAGISADLMNISDGNIHISSISPSVNVSSIRLGYPAIWTPADDEGNMFGGVVVSLEGNF